LAGAFLGVTASTMLVPEAASVAETVRALPGLLYPWIPALVGIAAATAPLDRSAWKTVALLLLVGVTATICLDLLGHASPDAEYTTVLVSGEVRRSILDPGVYPESWVRTVVGWLSGRFDGVNEVMTLYPANHPRTQVVTALGESAACIGVFGAVGSVLAVRRWAVVHVVFRDSRSRFSAFVFIGWLTAPFVARATDAFVIDQMSAALFGGGRLLSILVPSLVVAAAGVAGIAYGLWPSWREGTDDL
jgi:hypothetical protein